MGPLREPEKHRLSLPKSYNERKKDYEYVNILNISISQILTTKGETTCVTNKKTKSLY